MASEQAKKLRQISMNVDNDTHLYFVHPHVKGGGNLAIRTGANIINWGYTLNTQTIPTYGGEVQQILSCMIDELQISGNTRDNHQLEDIHDWFRAYMTVASGFSAGQGLHRDEVPIRFSYPARGWEFNIQVMEAPSFQIGTGLVATEWSIVAFIVPSGEDVVHILQEETMSNMTKVLLPKTGIPMNIGYSDRNKFSENVPYGDDNVDLNAFGAQIGENFQRLIGSYAVGDFAHFAFDGAMSTARNGLNTSSEDFWTSIYGTDQLQLAGQTSTGLGAEAQAGDGSSTTYTAGSTTYPDPSGKQFNTAADGPPQKKIVAWLASNAIAKDIPPVLIIMAALDESHLCNLDHAHSDPTPGTSSEGFFQQQHEFYDSEIPGYATKPDLQIQAFLKRIVAEKHNFPAAADATTQTAANLGKWIQAVQRSGGDGSNYAAYYAQAKQLLSECGLTSTTTSSNAQGDGTTTGKVYAKAAAIDARNLPYGVGGHGQNWVDAESASSYDCSSSTSMALHAGGLMSSVSGPQVSDWFLSWGEAGEGKTMTVWVHPGSGGNGHVWIQFHNRKAWRFDTSAWGSGGSGPHLRYTSRSLDGFQARRYPQDK